jgi:hypothetical protein
MLHGIPMEPRRRVKREHHTMRSLAAKAYRRGRMYLRQSVGPDIPATLFDVIEQARPTAPLPSWRDRLRGWRDKAARVFRAQRGQ